MNSFPATFLKTFNVYYYFLETFSYIYAMHNRHILQRIMQCVVSVVYIVICNIVVLL